MLAIKEQIQNRKIGRLYKGDNLEILRLLLEDKDICCKVRLIYIDPPYGTGQSFTISTGRNSTISRAPNGKTAYHDNLKGSDFIEFLRPRLELLREILADDGSIYLHIDCKIGHYVKILLDEIFGQDNFKNDITRIKCNPKNFERSAFSNMKDMILFYTKAKKAVWNQPREPFIEKELLRLFPKIDDEGRHYTTTPLHAPGETKNGPTGQIWKGILPPPGRHWRYNPAVLDKFDKEGLIEWSKNKNPRLKKYADEASKNGKCLQDVWVFKDPPYPIYPTEKNIDLLKVIISASSNPGDIVLDSFCGSGSTLVAAKELDRQWIGIDNSEVAIDICSKRLEFPNQLNIF